LAVPRLVLFVDLAVGAKWKAKIPLVVKGCASHQGARTDGVRDPALGGEVVEEPDAPEHHVDDQQWR
jgi:hypothetical protein